MESPTTAIVSLALGLALVAGSQLAVAPSDAGLVSRQDVRVLRERIRKTATAREVAIAAAGRQLLRESMSDGEVEALSASIRVRIVRELERYAGSLRGRQYDSLDDAFEVIAARERILIHSAVSRPRAFAEGRVLTFIVDEPDADRLELGIGEMIRAHEGGIREAAREMRSAGNLTEADLRALRDFSWRHAEARGRGVLEEVRDAPFFSEADARSYLESAISAALDELLSRFADPSSRPALLEEARRSGSS